MSHNYNKYTQDKQKQNYLSTCLQSIPYMEAFDALRGHIKYDNQNNKSPNFEIKVLISVNIKKVIDSNK